MASFLKCTLSSSEHRVAELAEITLISQFCLENVNLKIRMKVSKVFWHYLDNLQMESS